MGGWEPVDRISIRVVPVASNRSVPILLGIIQHILLRMLPIANALIREGSMEPLSGDGLENVSVAQTPVAFLEELLEKALS